MYLSNGEAAVTVAVGLAAANVGSAAAVADAMFYAISNVISAASVSVPFIHSASHKTLIHYLRYHFERDKNKQSCFVRKV